MGISPITWHQMPTGRRPAARSLLGFVLLLAWSLLASAPGTAGAAAPSSTFDGWTEYHGDPTGSGVSTLGALNTATAAWTSPALDGDLYGQPLAAGGLVFVATENDTVNALNATTGALVWSTHIATPVPASTLPCGDITPTVGITGTPVIDAARSEIFVVADEFSGGTATHVLVGLSTTSGKVETTEAVDPPGANPLALLQRTGLTLDGGRVVFGFGGNYGDCGSYKGWVVSVAETGGRPEDFAVDSAAGESQGAIWMGGAAPVVDASGNIWVSAGNGSVTSATHAYDDSDSVLELSSSLSLLQYFAPSSWAADNAADKDFSMAPILLPDGQVLIAGKSRIAYLLDGHALGGIGGQQASLPDVCGTDIDGGAAVVGMTSYLPCMAGTVAVAATQSPPSLRLLWSSGVGNGPPLVAGGLVWTMNSGGQLSGLNPSTGKVQQQAAVAAPANHFPTPGIAPGLLLVPTSHTVVAFATLTPASASTTTATRPSTPTTTTLRHAAPSAQSGTGFPTAPVAGAVAGAVVVTFGLVLASRRRRSPSG